MIVRVFKIIKQAALYQRCFTQHKDKASESSLQNSYQASFEYLLALILAVLIGHYDLVRSR